MIESLKNRKIEKRPPTVKLQGRVLLLTEDPELIRKQLNGWDMPWDTSNPANNAPPMYHQICINGRSRPGR